MLALRSCFIPILTAITLSLFGFTIKLSAQYTLRIGVIDRPDGSLLAGARLAADHVNAAGGIVGADGTVFQLAVVDTPPDFMDIAVANMRQASVIAVLGPATDQLLAANSGQLRELDVPILAPATGDNVFPAASNSRFFRSRAPERLQIQALANYLVDSLAIRTIVTVQLDDASTANLIALANTLAPSRVYPSNLRFNQERLNLDQIAMTAANLAPDAVAIFGSPGAAAQAYNAIRAAGYAGEVVYPQSGDPAFIALTPSDTLPGIIGVSTWTYALDDNNSRDFTLAYAREYGRLPDELSAAGYDSVALIELAAASSGALEDVLASIKDVAGIQGQLSPVELPAGETSNNVVVTRLNEYGVANMVARYPEVEQDEAPTEVGQRAFATPLPTATSYPTATPTGYHLIVQSEFQNIRSGPGLEYEVIGQVLQGARLRILGTTVDNSWLVIDYRGQQGWMAAYLVETVGNRNLVPIMEPPATPTPAPTATTAPPREPDLIVLSADPQRLTLGQPTAINVTLLNQGLTAAGNFAIAASFEPGSQYAGVNQPGLGPGQRSTVQLWPTLNGRSGPQSTIIVVDLNQEVYEGAAGEANNQAFTYSYVADRPQHTSGSWTIASGSFDLDGDAVSDFSWNGNDLVAQGDAAMALMSNFASLDDAHYDAINAAQANIKSLGADDLQNSTVGIVTAGGRRGVMRLTNVTRNGSLTVAYRIYS